MKHIIRTSDRIQFKKCRRAWDISSKIRQNLEPIKSRPALEFGTAIHAALEVWYDPKTWDWDRRAVADLSLLRFASTNSLQLEKLCFNDGHRQPTAEETVEWQERRKLGLGMLRGFFKYSARADKEYKPLYTEIEFEVPLPPLWNYRDMTVDDADKVVYQGRIDAILEDSEGRCWIVDHKTCARIDEDVPAFLELDEQMKSYAWAAQQMLGIKIHGVIYQELYKGIPEPPKRNANVRKGCSFSVSKSQDTSYDLLLATIQEHDTAAYEAGLYDEVLQFFKVEGRQYFRRLKVRYNSKELEALGNQISCEAIDMLNDPFIYPNPNKWTCKWCDHRALCIATNEQGDTQYIKETQYTVRT